MVAVAGDRKLGRKKRGGEPPTKAVKIDRALVDMARLIATRRGVNVSEMLSEIVRAPLERAYAKMIRDLEGKS